jgi:hypothetical protein
VILRVRRLHRAIEDSVGATSQYTEHWQFSAFFAMQPMTGHSMLVDMYSPSISLGFVRFVSPKSVQRALDRFRISEIEVQDVSVMIKSLNDFSPAA